MERVWQSGSWFSSGLWERFFTGGCSYATRQRVTIAYGFEDLEGVFIGGSASGRIAKPKNRHDLTHPTAG